MPRWTFVPRPFRVAPWEGDVSLEGCAPGQPEKDVVGAPAASASESGVLSAKDLARIATGLWRIRTRMVDPDSGEALPEMKKVIRHVERVLEDLSDVGVEVIDHTGQAMPDIGASALTALAYEPRAGLRDATVVETVLPSVYLKGKSIQTGEVIVGKPDGTTDR